MPRLNVQESVSTMSGRSVEAPNWNWAAETCCVPRCVPAAYSRLTVGTSRQPRAARSRSRSARVAGSSTVHAATSITTP